MRKWVNFLAYQAVWFAVVASAARGHPALGIAAAAVFVIAQLVLSRNRALDARLMAAAALSGLIVDGALGVSGWLRYTSPKPAFPSHGAPLWILCLWVSFSLTLPRSLAGITQRRWLAGLLGAVGGPLAYASAARGFGAVEFAPPAARACAALALGWGGAMPLLAYLSQRGAAARSAALIEVGS
jgi:hypothetical protein